MAGSFVTVLVVLAALGTAAFMMAPLARHGVRHVPRLRPFAGGNEGQRPSGEFDNGDFEDPDPVGARGDEFCVIEMVSPSLPNPAPTTSRRRRVFRAPTNPTASSTTHAH